MFFKQLIFLLSFFSSTFSKDFLRRTDLESKILIQTEKAVAERPSLVPEDVFTDITNILPHISTQAKKETINQAISIVKKVLKTPLPTEEKESYTEINAEPDVNYEDDVNLEQGEELHCRVPEMEAIELSDGSVVFEPKVNYEDKDSGYEVDLEAIIDYVDGELVYEVEKELHCRPLEVEAIEHLDGSVTFEPLENLHDINDEELMIEVNFPPIVDYYDSEVNQEEMEIYCRQPEVEAIEQKDGSVVFEVKGSKLEGNGEEIGFEVEYFPIVNYDDSEEHLSALKGEEEKVKDEGKVVSSATDNHYINKVVETSSNSNGESKSQKLIIKPIDKRV